MGLTRLLHFDFPISRFPIEQIPKKKKNRSISIKFKALIACGETLLSVCFIFVFGFLWPQPGRFRPQIRQQFNPIPHTCQIFPTMAQRIVVYVSVESFPKKQIKFLVHFVALLIDKWELQGNLWGCA